MQNVLQVFEGGFAYVNFHRFNIVHSLLQTGRDKMVYHRSLILGERGSRRKQLCKNSVLSEVLELSMYIHMFAFRWKPGVTEEQKERVMAEIRGLQGRIPGLLETAVGVNISPRGQGYELGGVMKFADKASLDSYGPHPVHQKLVGWLRPLIEPVEVDFEVD